MKYLIYKMSFYEMSFQEMSFQEMSFYERSFHEMSQRLGIRKFKFVQAKTQIHCFIYILYSCKHLYQIGFTPFDYCGCQVYQKKDWGYTLILLWISSLIETSRIGLHTLISVNVKRTKNIESWFTPFDQCGWHVY